MAKRSATMRRSSSVIFDCLPLTESWWHPPWADHGSSEGNFDPVRSYAGASAHSPLSYSMNEKFLVWSSHSSIAMLKAMRRNASSIASYPR